MIPYHRNQQLGDRIVVGCSLLGWVLISWTIVVSPRDWWTVIILVFVALTFRIPIDTKEFHGPKSGNGNTPSDGDSPR